MIPNAFKNTFYQLPANTFINGWRRLTPCWYGISTVYTTTKRGRDERRKLTQRRFSSSGGWQGAEFPAALSAAVFRRSFQFRNALTTLMSLISLSGICDYLLSSHSRSGQKLTNADSLKSRLCLGHILVGPLVASTRDLIYG